jgi:hypothetical protein
MELAIRNQSGQITHLALEDGWTSLVKLTSHTVPSGKPLLLDMSEVTFLSSGQQTQQ